MKHYLITILFSLLLFPLNARAECNLKDDGDCCTKDTDCAAYFHPSLCAVMALNKVTIAKITEEQPKPASFCQGDIVQKLKADATSEKVICLNGACELDQDNG